MNDIAVMEAQVMHLERESRELRMTLRDQFAMHIIGGFVSYEPDTVETWQEYIDDIAAQAYEIADAMLKARKGGAA